MPREAVLGIDVGTSGAKVALVGADGRPLATGEEGYPITTPQRGFAESDPANWTAAVAAAVGRAMSKVDEVRLLGIGVVGQMHGAVLCDDAGIPLGPAILWPDRRSVAEVTRWRELPLQQVEALANPLVPGMTGPLVAWLATHCPELVERAACVLLAKDVVRSALVDEPAMSAPVTDRSDASATLLWDVPADRWAVEICAAVGVPGRLLPEVVASAAVVGQTGWVGNLTTHSVPGVPVVVGAGDTPAALVAIAPEGLLINFGTGAQALVARPTPDRGDADPSTHLYADVGSGWYAMAALMNGGAALEWVAGALGFTWDSLMSAAAGGSAGSVTFHPFLTGERGGIASPTSHAGWLGMGPDCTRDDLARAAVEGVVFAIRRGVELLGREAGTPGHEHAGGPQPVTLTGGGWRSDLLCRLMADALGRPVRRVDARSASATGAAMLAARGAGVDLQPIRAARGAGVDLQPIRAADTLVEPTASAQLEEGYRRWLDRLPATES